MKSQQTASKWSIREKLPLPEGFLDNIDMPEIGIQALLTRGCDTVLKAKKFLDHNLYSPASPFELPGMEKGVERISKAIRDHETIGVWGDFDVDGQTSTAILVDALSHLGAQVTYHIPVRARESHGIKLEPLKRFLATGVQVMLTCDTGISETEPIAYAQSNGIDVIVTDHHILPETLPAAHALINPQFLSPGHPLATLAGAGVAYQFAQALLERNDRVDYVPTLHDLAALGCIADLALLVDDTRYLAQSGLARLNEHPRRALAAMLDIAEGKKGLINEETVSFLLAPRLNAVGRLEDANPMVSFLLSEDQGLINLTVNRLEGMNEQRKILCDQVLRGALAQVDQNPRVLETPVLILSHPDWPAGVVGIVASRLVEMFHKPVILLVAPEGQALRGSARSIEGIDITAALTRNASLLLSFGGHAMAAGLSISPESFPAFQRAVNQSVQELLLELKIEEQVEIDALVSPDELTLDVVKNLERLAPFGPGNPPLTFAVENVELASATPVGKLKEHLQMTVENQAGEPTIFIWWHGAGLPQPDGPFDLAYSARSSDYRGKPQVQYEWLGFRQIQREKIAASGKRKIHNIDLRLTLNPHEALANLQLPPEAQIWQEGSDQIDFQASTRLVLSPYTTLVLWTTPPDLALLKEIISKVKPRQVYWFLVDPPERTSGKFLGTLGKLLKSGIQAGTAVFQIDQLAAFTATTAHLVELGLKWHQAYGNLQIVHWDANEVEVMPGGIIDLIARKQIEKSLQHCLDELTAFSRYLHQVDLQVFMQELG